MKLCSLVTLSLAVSSAVAFAPSNNGSTQQRTSLGMLKESNRLDFLKNMASMGGLVALTTAGAGPANAAKYGSVGRGSPNSLDPKTAVIDSEILATDAVQKSITSVKGYLETVKAMQAALKGNDQTDIGASVRKDLDFVGLRVDLNTLNSAFDEDTQRGTDRLVRIILQDITELEQANRQKDGIPRSERRLGIMNGKLDKLNKAFSDLLSAI
mmetsp:Transcript_26599/g.25465  ORF Transcript_26599/g.25465 Transcript_26599/m.25465 type:complete len:212 (-) Transcript_26599:88-723(-)|eukprot:CAMPEP_0197824978 /NCGR_PEP_ID=MMETSP1437-20131217/2143_1 /TAXON_ID=49252 ORGANISM="Eucampia antarctica, Strain CCMP1452" /NCGR_SAMPLE_ID=MMETSP1437 /ASSEMBLY_ACC=CAM_ASM_001096 /LENGTH=211 /DNA_ID=CAMNT_0043424803 /DNA_START=70 /DNA_END=705 /DNA_ORIENTATION=-